MRGSFLLFIKSINVFDHCILPLATSFLVGFSAGPRLNEFELMVAVPPSLLYLIENVSLLFVITPPSRAFFAQACAAAGATFCMRLASRNLKEFSNLVHLTRASALTKSAVA